MTEKPDIKDILEEILKKPDLPYEAKQIYGILNADIDKPLSLEKLKKINELKPKAEHEDWVSEDLEKKISERYKNDLKIIEKYIFDLPSLDGITRRQIEKAVEKLQEYSAIVSVLPSSSERTAKKIFVNLKLYSGALNKDKESGDTENIEQKIQEPVKNPFESMKETKDGRIFLATMKGFGIGVFLSFPCLFYQNGFTAFSAFAVFGAVIAGYLAYRRESN